MLAVCQLTHAVFKIAEDSDAGLITDLLTDALTHFAVDKVKRRITVVKQKREADKHIFFRKAGKGTRRGVCHLDFVGLQAFQHGPAVAERIVNVNVNLNPAVGTLFNQLFELIGRQSRGMAFCTGAAVDNLIGFLICSTLRIIICVAIISACDQRKCHDQRQK